MAERDLQAATMAGRMGRYHRRLVEGRGRFDVVAGTALRRRATLFADLASRPPDQSHTVRMAPYGDWLGRQSAAPAKPRRRRVPADEPRVEAGRVLRRRRTRAVSEGPGRVYRDRPSRGDCGGGPQRASASG